MASPFPNAAALRLVLTEIDEGVKNAVKNGGIEGYIKSVKGRVKQLFEAQKLGIFREVFEEFGSFFWSVIIEYRTSQKNKTFDRNAFLETYRLKLQVLESGSQGLSGTSSNTQGSAAAKGSATAKGTAAAKDSAAAQVSTVPQVPAAAAKVPATASKVPAVASKVPAAPSKVPAAAKTPQNSTSAALQAKSDTSTLVSGGKDVVGPTTGNGVKSKLHSESSSKRNYAPVKKVDLDAAVERNPVTKASDASASAKTKPRPKSDPPTAAGSKLTNLADIVEHLEKSVGENKSGKAKKKGKAAASALDPKLTLAEKYHVLAVQALDAPDSPIHDFQKKKQVSKHAESVTRDEWNDSASEWKDSQGSDDERPASGSKRKRKQETSDESRCERCVEMEFECKERDSALRKGGLKACFECWRDKKKCSLRKKSEIEAENNVAVGSSKTQPAKKPRKHNSSSKEQVRKFKSAQYVESSDTDTPPHAPPKKKMKTLENTDKEKDEPRAPPNTVMPAPEIIEIQSDMSENNTQHAQVRQNQRIRKGRPDDNNTAHKKIRREESGDISDSQLARNNMSDNESVKTGESIEVKGAISKKTPTPIPTHRGAPQIPHDLSNHPYVLDMEKRLVALENTQRSYEEHCADIYSQLEDIKREFEDLEKSAGFQQVKVWNQDEQINSMERSISHHKQLADGTASSLNHAIELLKGVRKDVARLQGRMDGVVERLENVEGRLVDYPDSDVDSAPEHNSGPSRYETASTDTDDDEDHQAETEVGTTSSSNGTATDADANADNDVHASANANAEANADTDTDTDADADADADADTDADPDGEVIPGDNASGESKSNDLDHIASSGGHGEAVQAANSNAKGEACKDNTNGNEHAADSGSSMSLDSESNNDKIDLLKASTNVLPDYKSDTSPSSPKSDVVWKDLEL